MKHLIRIIILLLSSASLLTPQSYQVRTYTLEDGLPTNVVYDVKQDKNALIWFSTERGVSKYDGHRWTNYELNDGLPQAEYFRMQVDNSNTIWAVPRLLFNKIAYFQNNKWNFLPSIPIKRNSEHLFNSFDFVYEDGRIVLCLGTMNGIFLYKNNSWTKIGTKEGLLDSVVYNVKSIDGKFFTTTRKGLSIIQNGKVDNSLNQLLPTEFRTVFAIDVEKEKSKTNQSVTKIWLLGKNWIGYLQDGKFSTLTIHNRLKNSPATYDHYFLCSDKNRRIFYGNFEEKFFIDKTSGRIKYWGLESGFVGDGGSNIFIDKESNIWIPTQRGVDKINSLRFENYSKTQGLLDNEVTAILQVKPGYIIFGHNYGVTILNNEKLKTISFKNLIVGHSSNSRILDIAKDSHGNIWFAGSFLGLGKLIDDDHIIWMKEQNRFICTAIGVDYKGNVWAGINSDVYRLINNKLIKVCSLRPTGLIIRKLLFKKDGSIFAATTSGLFIIKDGNNSIIETEELKLSRNFYSITYYKDNKYFLGSANGLYLYDGKSIVKFRENDFNIDRKVFFSYKDKAQNFWFGTDDGVIRWDGTTSRKYTVEDGLSGRELNRNAVLEDSDGKIWFGTDRGLSYYDCNYDFKDIPPAVNLKYLENSDGHRYNLAQPIKLGSTEKTIIFDFIAVSFKNEKDIIYQVKLEGFDKNWINIGSNNEIRYTSLEPGKYKFSIKAKNMNGEWGPIISSNTIVITSPFYNQWWFYILSLLIAGSFIYVGFIFFSQRKYQTLLEQQVAIRTRDLKESESKLKTIIDNAPNIISTINYDGNISFLNLAYDWQKDLHGNVKNIFDVFDVEKTKEIKERLDQIFIEKQTIYFEFKIDIEPNKTLWFASYVSPVITGETINEAIAISVDVTEKRNLEFARREIEERQNTILKALPIIIYSGSLESKFKISWISDNVNSVTGFQTDDFLKNENFQTTRIHPDDIARVIKVLNNVKDGKPIEIDYRWQCADGNYKWFFNSSFPKKVDENGKVEYLGLLLDISEQKKMQTRLERLNSCLLNYGIDPVININSLVALIGEELNPSFVLYNCIKDEKLQSIGKWQIPENFIYHDQIEGNIFYDVIKNEINNVCILKNLDKTTYADTEPNVKLLNLKTIICMPVSFGDSEQGSLCVVYKNDQEPSVNDLDFLSIVRSAIAIEEERLLSNELINHSLKEKEMLLKEIHHRVKNNLQIVSSLLYLQASTITDTKTRFLFDDSVNRIKSIALLHEELYKSKDLAHINISEYINHLTTNILGSFSTNNNISTKIEIDDILLSVDAAIPCGLIINELVTNSIKYAFPKDVEINNPEIFIFLKRNNEKIHLIIGDNGIGLPQEINFNNLGISLGLKLVNMLTTQIKGEISIDRNVGTKYQIIFNETI